jgi:hypothetical protein
VVPPSRLPEKEKVMSKYRKFERKEIATKTMNPMWRGAGCILFLVVLAISYFGTMFALPMVVATGQVPPEILANVKFPPTLYKIPILNNICLYLSSINELWLKLILFFLIVMVLATVTSLIYSFIYQMVGPARYTEMDAPEMDLKAKAYKR